MLLRKEEKKRGGMIVIWRDDFDEAIAPMAIDQVSIDNIWFWINDFLQSEAGLRVLIDRMLCYQMEQTVINQIGAKIPIKRMGQ